MNQVLARITKRMKEKGITQRELTKKLGLSENNFGSWKRGTTNSYMKKLPEIAAILDTTMEWLVNGDREVNIEKEKAAEDLYDHFIAAPEYLQQAVRTILQMD